VSAHVLVRGNEAAAVDTGVPGSADDIGETLGDVGLDHSNVAHVILTHLHPDHISSIGGVMGMADGATAYAGEADIGGIDFDPITPADDGDDDGIFGLEVIATPSARRLAELSFNTLLAGHGDPVEDMADTAVAAMAAAL
jgi:glyoxylase-like metal-dependent hydrolase (beta-lactamase superfamily II)